MHGKRVWVVFGLIALTGCAKGDAEPETLDDGKEIFCSGFCESGRRCQAADGGCEAYCERDYQPTGMREGVLSEVGRCMQELEDCASWSTDDPSRPCFDQVATTIPASRVMIDYCESASLSYFECDGWWGVDECLSSVTLWSDTVLRQAQFCHEQSCSNLTDCETAVFDEYR